MILANPQKERKSLKNIISKFIHGYFKEVILKSLNFFNLSLLALYIFSMVINYFEGFYFAVVLIINIIVTTLIQTKLYNAKKILSINDIMLSRIIRDGKEYIINSKDIKQDDIMILEYGNIIPADGHVITGYLVVNESHINGSGSLGFKIPGDVVFKGSIVINGNAKAKALNENLSDKLLAKFNASNKKGSVVNSFVNKLLYITLALSLILFVITIIFASLSSPIVDFSTFAAASKPLMVIFIMVVPFFLLPIITFVYYVSYLRFTKKNIKVNKYEKLDRIEEVDTICFDKTGVLTSDNMVLQEIVTLGEENQTFIKSVVFRLLSSTGDNDPTARALLNVCTSVNNDISKIVIPLSFGNKYSAASFSDGTYIMGSVSEINIINRNHVLNEIEKYKTKGYRVLVLAKGDKQINSRTYKEEVLPLALLILREEFKEEAKSTIRNLVKQGIDIRIISGDNLSTTCLVAKEVGMEHLDKVISLESLSDEQISNIADEYYIFARCNPYQKSLIISALKKKGHKVMMVGDGDNDYLAFMEADYALSVPSSRYEPIMAVDGVLGTKKIDSLLDVKDEGSVLMNNIHKILSFFTAKAIIGSLSILLLLILGFIRNNPNPIAFTFSKLFILEILSLIAGFAFALSKDNKIYKYGLWHGIIRYTVAGSLLGFIGVATIFITYYYGQINSVYTGINTLNTAADMSALYLTVFTALLMFRLATPSKFNRLVPFISVLLITGILLLINYLVTMYTDGFVLFGINFKYLSGVNYLVVGMLVFVTVVLLFVGINVYDSIFGGQKEEEGLNEN